MTKFLPLMMILILFLACSKPTIEVETKNVFLENLGKQENSETYKKADKVIELSFPQDHNAHDDFKTEWWYFTGNLSGKKKDFGYQFTIFRNNVNPELKQAIDWEAKNIYMGHLGLSDLTAKEFYSFERFEREAIKLAGNEASPFKVWLNHWYVKSLGKSFFPVEIFAMEEGVGYKFVIEPIKLKILQGDRGLSQKSAELGNASYYYSYTRMKTQGEVYIKGKSYKVTGLSWMDREWSTSALAQDQVGWDWFSLQLDNDTEVMIYQLRNKDGSIDEYSSGVFVDSSSKKINIKKDDFELKPLEYWKSEDGHEYPLKWSLKIPNHNLDLVVETKLKKQKHDFAISYWEGAVEVHGNKMGKGYLEMTGY